MPTADRHEKQSIAAALATYAHHSAQRLETARAGGWESEQDYTATIRKAPTPQPELFDLSFDEEPGLARPDQLSEVRPQEQVQRHTVFQIVDAVLGFPTLDVPAPQMVEQLPGVLQFFATRLLVVAEPVVDVPKISSEDIPTRRSCREPQLAEQLVEVPTILYFLKQTVDTPARRLYGFSRNKIQQRRPSSSLTFQHSVEVFKVHAQDRVQQRPRHPQFLALQLIGSTLRIRRFKCFFSNFFSSPNKSARVT